jgi:hypothetical protein
MNRPIILKHRLRRMERPFGWVPLSLLHNGHWAALSAEAKILYCFLCIVSDRRGISFYGNERLQQSTGLGPHDLEHARDELVQRDLIAVDTSFHTAPTVQLLSLPSRCRDPTDKHAENLAQGQKTRVMPPDASPWTDEERLQAVHELISRLSTVKTSSTSRGPNDDT